MADPELFGRILVGVDSGDHASSAVVRGIGLAATFGCELDLVHAVELAPSLWPGVDEDQRAALHARALAQARIKTLHRLRETVRSAGASQVSPDDLLRVCPGHPAKVILDSAEESGAGLIVLGAHGKRSMFDFGGTARVVLSRTTIPVWREVGPPSPIQRILVPVDFSEHSRRAVDYAHALAMRLGATVRIFHCYEPPSFAYATGEDSPDPHYVVDQEREAAAEELDRWTAASQWEPIRVESLCVEGAPLATILEQAASVDLIVTGTHGRTGLSRFLIGSVAYGVLKHATQPVLVVPSTKQAWLLEDGARQDADALAK